MTVKRNTDQDRIVRRPAEAGGKLFLPPIERIEVTPNGDTPAISLHGDLAGLLSLSAGLQN